MLEGNTSRLSVGTCPETATEGASLRIDRSLSVLQASSGSRSNILSSEALNEYTRPNSASEYACAAPIEVNGRSACL